MMAVEVQISPVSKSLRSRIVRQAAEVACGRARIRHIVDLLESARVDLTQVGLQDMKDLLREAGIRRRKNRWLAEMVGS
jgi:hypothetical protein